MDKIEQIEKQLHNIECLITALINSKPQKEKDDIYSQYCKIAVNHKLIPISDCDISASSKFPQNLFHR